MRAHFNAKMTKTLKFERKDPKRKMLNFKIKILWRHKRMTLREQSSNILSLALSFPPLSSLS